MKSFPFVGDWIEVLSYDGVRYQGRLESVNSTEKFITIEEVHHYGTEDRQVEGLFSKPAKGVLPPYEKRIFHSQYIVGIETLFSPSTEESAVPVPATAITPSSSCITQADFPSSQHQVALVQPYSVEGQAYRGRGDSPSTQQVPPPAEQAGNRKRKEDWELPQLVLLDEEEEDQSQSSKRICQLRDQPPAQHPNSSRVSAQSSRPAHPLYFIVQIQSASPLTPKGIPRRRAIGVLINAEHCSQVPVYVAIPFEYCSTPPLPTQVWRVGGSFDARTAQQALIPAQYWNGDDNLGELAYKRKHGGSPWMINGLLTVQALAKREGLQLVWAAIKQVGQGNVTGMGSKGNRVKVNAPGCINSAVVQLTHEQRKLAQASQTFLSVGTTVAVEMVRLPAGCWVGPKFVLPPDISYHLDRAPFKPSVEPQHMTRQSVEGEYYPVGILL